MSLTEFRVLQHGVERKLFSIRETKDTSIIVAQKVAATTFGSGRLLKVKDHHFTAHAMRSFDEEGVLGHKFKTSAQGIDGTVIDQSIIVRASLKRPKLLWPLDTAIYGFMDGPAFDLSRRKTVGVVPLIGYIPARDALQYTIFVHDPTVNMPRVQGFNNFTHHFPLWQLRFT